MRCDCCLGILVTKERANSNDSESNECTICFESLETFATIKLEKCKHEFHIQCIKDWKNTSGETVTTNNQCPVCRMPIHDEFSSDESVSKLQCKSCCNCGASKYRIIMGLIGVRIRIAKKEKLVPEFEMRTEKASKSKPTKNTKSKDEKPKDTKIKVEEIEVEGAKVEVVKVEGKEDTAKSESERIALESKKMETLETLEEEEAKLK